jgi:hypothetical protein
MIDEKIYERSKSIEHTIEILENVWRKSTPFTGEHEKILYLIRLGLWAVNHGIPALIEIDGAGFTHEALLQAADDAEAALSALPKDEK